MNKIVSLDTLKKNSLSIRYAYQYETYSSEYEFSL
jgi:hypothetical protein